MTDVLLTYGWVRSVYAALRNLVGHGCRVQVACSEKFGMCQMSRHKKGFSRYPSFFHDEHGYVESILTMIDKYKPLVLFPGHEDIEILARHRSEIPSTTVLPVHDFEKIQTANDKAATYTVAVRSGVKTPERYEYDSVEKIFGKKRRICASHKYVIRLRRSNSAKGVFYADSQDACIRVVKKCINDYSLSEERYPIVQEYVTGEGWGVSCLYWHGERIAHFTHRRLREKTATGGTSTLREHKPNKNLEDMAFALLDSLQWHGLAMVEFKYNPETEQAWFIEINPRLWGSIHLAVSAGVEFPYLLYLAANKGPDVARHYHENAHVKYPWRARWYLGDMMCAVQEMRHGRIFKAAKLLLPGGTDTYDDISAGDPGAFIGEMLHYGAGFFRSGSVNPVEKGMLG